MAEEKKPSFTSRKIANPTAPPPPEAEWVEVEIELTEDQIARLRELGVETDRITIQTYDISRLGSVVPN